MGDNTDGKIIELHPRRHDPYREYSDAADELIDAADKVMVNPTPERLDVLTGYVVQTAKLAARIEARGHYEKCVSFHTRLTSGSHRLCPDCLVNVAREIKFFNWHRISAI